VEKLKVNTVILNLKKEPVARVTITRMEEAYYYLQLLDIQDPIFGGFVTYQSGDEVMIFCDHCCLEHYVECHGYKLRVPQTPKTREDKIEIIVKELLKEAMNDFKAKYSYTATVEDSLPARIDRILDDKLLAIPAGYNYTIINEVLVKLEKLTEDN